MRLFLILLAAVSVNVALALQGHDFQPYFLYVVCGVLGYLCGEELVEILNS